MYFMVKVMTCPILINAIAHPTRRYRVTVLTSSKRILLIGPTPFGISRSVPQRGSDGSTPHSFKADLGALNYFFRVNSLAEDAGAGGAAESCFAVLDAQHRAFAQGNHGRVVLLEVLQEALFAGLAHVCRVWIGVEIVRVDLE